MLEKRKNRPRERGGIIESIVVDSDLFLGDFLSSMRALLLLKWSVDFVLWRLLLAIIDQTSLMMVYPRSAACCLDMVDQISSIKINDKCQLNGRDAASFSGLIS
jgi:hypothetical protein